MLLAFQLRVVVLLTAYRHALAGNTLVNHGAGLDSDDLCAWNCTAVESDLTALKDEVQSSNAKNKLVVVVVRYKIIVEDECVNQTSRNSSSNATELCQVCFVNKQLSTLAKAMETLMNSMFYISEEERKEIQARCTLKLLRTIVTRPMSTYYNGAPSIFYRSSHLAHLGLEFDSIDCTSEKMDNSLSCTNVSRSAPYNTTTPKGPQERRASTIEFYFLIPTFVTVFIYYCPAVLCLFSPTEVTKDGLRQIILEGASPVSFRSLVGNYFFSEGDTMWHRARTFILLALVLPLLYGRVPAIYFNYLQHKGWFPSLYFPGISHLSHPFIIVSYGCYCIQAFYLSFASVKLVKANPCSFCKFFKPTITKCHGKYPRLIANHLRLQPLILVECWRLCTRCILNYTTMSLTVLSSSKFPTALFFLRCLLQIFLFSTIPAVIVLLLTSILIACFLAITLTSPIAVLCGATKFGSIRSGPPYMLRLFMCMFVTSPAIPGAMFLLLMALAGTFIAVLVFSILLFSEKSLPYVACFVLVLYYLWSSYSSFTNKYHDLALALFTHYKKSRHGRFTNIALNADEEHEENTPDFADNNDNAIKTPKELFDIACEELMPLREGVYVLTLKVITIVSFVFFAFSFIMMFNVGATSVMKVLFMFLTGSFPKVITIYVDGGRQKKIEAMSIDEKIHKIVQKYIYKWSNQVQEKCETNVDKEEEGIELVSM